MNKQKITMQDIAKMAGVGKTTVSRYFNGGYLKEETRLKIKKIIDEYNYHPNAFAKSLKAKETKILGVIIPSLTSRIASRMLSGLDEVLKENGYTLLIINTNYHVEEEIAAIDKLWQMKVDGIILSATQIKKEHYEIIKKINIPFVTLFQNMDNVVTILNDDYLAGYKIGQYVAHKNHQDIIYLGVSEEDEAVGIIRKNGIIQGLKDFGKAHIEIVYTDFTFETTRKVVKKILKRDKLPTAIICATDNIAFATLKELKEDNIKVPQQISITGFGGYEVSQLLTPSLCTIKHQIEDAGRKAGEYIIKMIKGEKVDKITVLGFSFIEGNSVKKYK